MLLLSHRKFIRCRNLRANDSGIILIVVLWILAILSIFVFIVGWGARTEISYAKYRVAKVKTKQYVWAGIIFGLDQLTKDVSTEKNKLKYFWFSKNNKVAPQNLATKISVDTGYFQIGYRTRLADNDPYTIYQGFQDETGRINLNGLTLNNYHVLEQLLIILGFDNAVALNVAASVVDWIDRDNTPAEQGQGAEDSYYMSLSKPYHCKNLPLDSIEELLFIKGITSDIFQALKPYVTVFPKYSGLRENFNTASEEVLKALARSVVGPQTNTTREDADSLVGKILDYQEELSSQFSNNDKKMDFNDIKLNAKEQAIYLTINPYRAIQPGVVRFDIQGAEPSSHVETNIEVVVDPQTSNILSWQETTP
ncbi:MAG: general secretion pathway protein GspK [Candidatus Omnitrophica bacterium]|nr:general secretion pathway protein GspK [Candidatus Omnitrophota bacterium]